MRTLGRTCVPWVLGDEAFVRWREKLASYLHEFIVGDDLIAGPALVRPSRGLLLAAPRRSRVNDALDRPLDSVQPAAAPAGTSWHLPPQPSLARCSTCRG